MKAFAAIGALEAQSRLTEDRDALERVARLTDDQNVDGDAGLALAETSVGRRAPTSAGRSLR